MTIRALRFGYEAPHSGGITRSIDLVQDLVGIVINYFDPFHRTWAGRKLRAMSDQNAQAYYARTKIWSEQQDSLAASEISLFSKGVEFDGFRM